MKLTNVSERKRKPVNTAENMIYGKKPPEAKSLEVLILGVCMLEKNAFEVAREIIWPECFYVDAHQRIFRAMQSLNDRYQPIDIEMVCHQLKTTDELEIVGGAYTVLKLTNNVTSSAMLESYCRIILEVHMKREMIRISGETLARAYEESSDIFDILSEHERELTAVSSGPLQSNYSDIQTEAVKAVSRIEELRGKNQDFTGIPSGFRELDRITHGWQDTDLIILAARPSVGKTAFALNLARNAAMRPEKRTAVAFFSLEMSKGQLVNRILSTESEIWLEKIQRGKLNDREMEVLYKNGLNAISKAPIYIDDTAGLNIYELRAKCRRMKRKHDIGLIIIDYLQLMSGTGDRNSNREQEISRISRDLKGLAKQLNVPVIALSQLSREVEKRSGAGKMPQLSDLRESGAIEQDADMVMFLYRPEYYQQDVNENGESTKGETHVKIAKHRNGDLGLITLRANLAIQKFYDADISTTPVSLGPGAWRPVDSQSAREDKETPF